LAKYDTTRSIKFQIIDAESACELRGSAEEHAQTHRKFGRRKPLGQAIVCARFQQANAIVGRATPVDSENGCELLLSPNFLHRRCPFKAGIAQVDHYRVVALGD
jgi:hypothetical protein